MFQSIVIGHLGADAEVKASNGSEFVTIRIAHSNRWKGADGAEHEETVWVDAILNGKPPVTEYLKKGQLVCVWGNTTTRVYSSPKDRCMKAGVTISVRTIELLGAKPDVVPSSLIDEGTGAVYRVDKFYRCQDLIRQKNTEEFIKVVSANGTHFEVNREGWVLSLV